MAVFYVLTTRWSPEVFVHHVRGLNRDRDLDTDERLRSLGWEVLRVWEHVPPGDAADEVEACLIRLGAGAALGRARPGQERLASS